MVISDELKLYASVKDELSLFNSCILRADCVVFPSLLRGRLIELAYEGHPGVVQRVREAAWWPGVSIQVCSLVANCIACAVANENNTCRAVSLMPVGWPKTAWSKIAIDIVGELYGMPQSKRLAITVIDLHSRWPEVVLIRSPSSPVVISILSELFARWGLLEELVSDNDSAFISKKFKSFFRSCGIHHNRLSLCHPESSAILERFYRSMKAILHMAQFERRPPEVAIRNMLATFRLTVKSLTGQTPASLMVGRQLRVPSNSFCCRLPTYPYSDYCRQCCATAC